MAAAPPPWPLTPALASRVAAFRARTRHAPFCHCLDLVALPLLSVCLAAILAQPRIAQAVAPTILALSCSASPPSTPSTLTPLAKPASHAA